jgi:aspartyl-tRNA(Asn)/glutamyl-tRNA(Gln) amidotransferase subunit C
MKNSKLTTSEVKNIAKLAKLDLKQSEIKKFQMQLGKILDYFDVLNKVNTDKVEPTSQVTGLSDIYRDDIESPSLNPIEALSGGKRIQGGMFKTNIVVTKI